MSCPSPASDSTPCSNLGRCVDGVCQCFPGFAGINCGIECKGGSENPCSLNGDCQADGSCVCFPGFRGEACSIECPGGAQNPCNGNGLCTEEGRCACFHGYRNSDCSKKCPGGLEAFLDGNQIVARECSGKPHALVRERCSFIELIFVKETVNAKQTARASVTLASAASTARWSPPTSCPSSFPAAFWASSS